MTQREPDVDDYFRRLGQADRQRKSAWYRYEADRTIDNHAAYYEATKAWQAVRDARIDWYRRRIGHAS